MVLGKWEVLITWHGEGLCIEIELARRKLLLYESCPGVVASSSTRVLILQFVAAKWRMLRKVGFDRWTMAR